jgi:uncharacterized membrane protein (DUF106 family)
MQPRSRPRSSGGGLGRRRILIIAAVLVVGIVAVYFLFFPGSPSKVTTGASISLNPSTDIEGSMITISGQNLTADRNVTATFDSSPINLTGTCTTGSSGTFVGCSFIIPKTSSGSHAVVVNDGTKSAQATLTVPGITPPYSTILVSLTSLGLGFVTQLVTRRIVDLNAERRMKAEVSAFNKEKREATLAKDKAKVEKLRKRELQVRQAQTKISTARLKVTAITFVPLLGVYYLMAISLGGFGVIVGYIPIPIPYIAGIAAPAGGWEVSLFWWYFISSFTFSALLSRLLHTTT